MRPARFSLLILFAAAPVVALEGRVVDEATGSPLPNVELSILGRAQTVRSNDAGRFVLVPDPQLPFELLVILPSGRYLKPLLVEQLAADGSLRVEVPASITESVTVAGAAPGIRSTPANGTTTLGREEMQSRQPRNLTQSLENVPGVSNVSEGHASVPAIRGLAQARSLLLIDGARVTSERRIGPSATFLDPYVLEGVEVSRGPGSVAYGSDAFGGVILARTRRPQPGGELAFGVSAGLGAGVPEGRVGVTVESGLGERSGLLVSVSARDFDDYESPEGTVQNSGSSDSGLLASYSHLVSHGLFTISLQGNYGRDVERPRTNSGEVRFYYPTEDSLRLTATYESGPALGLDGTQLSLFLGDSRIVTDQDTFATESTPRHVERADVSAMDFGLRAAATKHRGQARVDFGIDLNGRFDLEAQDVTIDYDAQGAVAQRDDFTTIENARRLDAGVYLSADGAVSASVSLAGGLRFDRVCSTNEGGYFGDLGVCRSEPSGFAAVTLGPFAAFSTSLQYSRGFRDARLSDRFFRGVTGAGFITGNPDLDAETSDQYDLALRYGKARWHVAVYFYDYRIDDLIERYEEPPASDDFFFRNRGRARIRGAEVELQAELPAAVSLQVAAGTTDGESLDDGAPLDDIPPGNLRIQARKAIGERGWVQLRGAWTGKLDEPGPTEVTLDSYVVLDASAGWRLGAVELQLLVRNVLDETYLLTADRRSPPAPGTSALLSAFVTF